MNIKACIFDLDGTLADTVESIAHNANIALNQWGLPSNPTEAYKEYAGDGAYVMIKRAFQAAGGADEQLLANVYETYLNVFETGCMYHVVPYTGICQMLEGLKKRNIKIAVLSNKPHQRTIEVVEALFGKAYFDDIQGMVSEGTKKPNPIGALTIADAFQVKPEECLYVGDTNTDMETGINAKMHTVGVTWGFRTEQELRESGGEHIIHDALELVTLCDE